MPALKVPQVLPDALLCGLVSALIARVGLNTRLQLTDVADYLPFTVLMSDCVSEGFQIRFNMVLLCDGFSQCFPFAIPGIQIQVGFKIKGNKTGKIVCSQVAVGS